MNSSARTPWERLNVAARRAPARSHETDEPAIVMPAGFATRVVARAELGAGGIFRGDLFERFATRALGLAGACACAMLLWSGLAVEVGASSVLDAAVPLYDGYADPVAALLEVAQP